MFSLLRELYKFLMLWVRINWMSEPDEVRPSSPDPDSLDYLDIRVLGDILWSKAALEKINKIETEEDEKEFMNWYKVTSIPIIRYGWLIDDSFPIFLPEFEEILCPRVQAVYDYTVERRYPQNVIDQLKDLVATSREAHVAAWNVLTGDELPLSLAEQVIVAHDTLFEVEEWDDDDFEAIDRRIHKKSKAVYKTFTGEMETPPGIVWLLFKLIGKKLCTESTYSTFDDPAFD